MKYRIPEPGKKASGWIYKTLLLIKQHITYMNISRYANIDKFVNIRYIFLLACRAYSWLVIISASPNVDIKIPEPGTTTVMWQNISRLRRHAKLSGCSLLMFEKL
jgi:hypothetical protein